jgi:8-oxo-dGTP pyrophosphatase MutT (NUDIX family)
MNLERLKALFSQTLPGERAHQAFSPMRGSSKQAIENGAPFKLSAVAILLFPDEEGELHTIVTKRQEYDGTHSGQVSFPGGKYEPSDLDTLHTAKRESKEEIGIDMKVFEVIGNLSDVYIPVSQFLIKPYVFYSHHSHHEYSLSEREVHSIHQLHLKSLFEETAIIYEDIHFSNGMKLSNVPHFHQENLKIWGATALMLNELKYVLKGY